MMGKWLESNNCQGYAAAAHSPDTYKYKKDFFGKKKKGCKCSTSIFHHISKFWQALPKFFFHLQAP